MKSTADYLSTQQVAARTALELIQRQGETTAAALWALVGSSWQCLATLGAADSLPSAQALSAGRLPGPDGAALPLDLHGTTLGWLVWRGKIADNADAVLALLVGHLHSASLNSAQSQSRVMNETLLEISQLPGECNTLDEMLPKLHRLLMRLMDASNFYIALFDEQGGQLYYPFYADQQDPAPPSPEAVFSKEQTTRSLTAWLMRMGKPLVLTRQRLLEVCEQEQLVLEGPLPELWMGVPLTNVSNAVIGAAVLQFYANQAPCTSAEQALFLFVTRHIAYALDRMLYRSQLERQVWLRTCELEGVNARLRSEISDRQRAERFQDVLFRIADLSNTSLSLEAFLAGVHRLLMELVAGRNCQVALYDMNSDMLSFPYCADDFQQVSQTRRPGRGLVEQVLHSGRPLLLDRTPAQLNPTEESTAPPMCSWLGVPLYCGHELLGVLSVHSYQNDVIYSYRDQEVLEFVANNIGTALARVRAMHDLQNAYAELEERVRERTSELDAVNAQLEFDSLHDPLTKLPNRNYFAKTLRRAWDSYLSGNGARFSVIFIDLDRFKLVNDTLGHLAGDHLLFEAGARIRSCLRHYDFLARLGGDEFAILLFGTETLDGCEMIARRIVSEFERPVILAGREVFSTASVGVVLADRDHYHKAEELLRDADHAMYCTKQQGRQGYTVFNHQLRINQADQLALESELRRALDAEDQLQPFFQPFIDARSGELVGFESLVRWRHPQRGLISPALFLPVAEESGLITRVDRYMINAACRQLRQWLDAGLVGSDIALHLNLSSANFHDPELVSWVRSIIEGYQLPAAILHLEITESALIDVPEIAATVMHALHQLGVKLALDDFGTGYSALSYLHRYRFDVLKIDQSFVFDLDRKEESVAIVRAILALAQALGLDVVAEGVETAAQLARLQEMGCAKLQGYYFATPSPAEAIDWERLARFVQEFRRAA